MLYSMIVFLFSGTFGTIDVPYLVLSFVTKFCLKSALFFELHLPTTLSSTSKVESSKLEMEVIPTDDYHEFLNIHTMKSKAKSKQETRSAPYKLETVCLAKDSLVVSTVRTSNTLDARPIKHVILPVYNDNAQERAAFKLKPISPKEWRPVLNDEQCIKHMEIPSNGIPSMPCKLGFLCNWPDVAKEWTERKRNQGWPSDEIVKEIVTTGITVLPSQFSANDGEGDLWEYSFFRAEDTLERKALTAAQKDCFKATKLILEAVGCLDVMLNVRIMKHAFFYMCEETSVVTWDVSPANCIVSFIERISACVCERLMPHYFLRNANVLRPANEEDLNSLEERLKVARRHPFVCLFFVFDASFLAALLRPIQWMFDEAITTSQTWSGDRLVMLNNYFIPAAVRGIDSVILGGEFRRAFRKCVEATHDLRAICQMSDLSLEYFIQQLINFVPSLLDRWMMAFFVDVKLKTSFLDVVNGNEEQLSVRDMFGELLVHELQHRTSETFYPFIPAGLMGLDRCADTISQFENVLDDLDIDHEVICDVLVWGMAFFRGACKRKDRNSQEVVMHESKMKILQNLWKIHDLRAQMKERGQRRRTEQGPDGASVEI